jgi:hypothetical protein
MRAIAALFAAALLPLEADAAERVYALVVGNNEPPAGPAGDGLSTLRYADDDAVRYTELLQQFADEVRLHTVLDAQTRKRWGSVRPSGAPSLAAVRRSLAQLGDTAAKQRDAGDRITFYLVFSAHGAIGDDGEAFVSLLDAPLSRAVLFDEILARVPADRVHLVIDACHAGGVVGMRGKRSFGKEVDAETSDVGDEEAARWVAARTLARFPHVGVLASTTAGEQAHEWSAIESGVFSHEVLSAMWGAADINNDLKVEYSEVQAFVSAANRRVEDPRAVPKVVARPPPDDPHDPVADLGRFSQSMMITGDASTLGHFHIERHNGQRHVDANLGTHAMTIAVPAGAASFLRADDEEVELRGTVGSTIAFADLPRRDVEVEERGSTAAGYRKALFREPYTPDYYRGYVDSIGAAPVAFDGVVANRAARPVSPPSPKTALASPPPQVADRPRDPSQRRMRAGVTFAVLAAGTGVASIVTGALAGRLRAQFNAADTEVEGHRLDDRHRPLAAAAIATGAAAVVCTVAAILYIRAAKRR